MGGPSHYVRSEEEVPFVLRVLWFFLIGWYATLPWVLIAWALNLTIVGLPAGLWMLNRVPLVLTLRLPRSHAVAEVRDGQVVTLHYQAVPQRSWLVRILYFLLIGWWFSLAWSLVGWLLSITIVGLPFGLWMLNRLPEVTTLMRH
jgi:hypothetical protein